MKEISYKFCMPRPVIKSFVLLSSTPFSENHGRAVAVTTVRYKFIAAFLSIIESDKINKIMLHWNIKRTPRSDYELFYEIRLIQPGDDVPQVYKRLFELLLHFIFAIIIHSKKIISKKCSKNAKNESGNF